MGTHKASKWKKTIKSWKIGDYIRQLSVVILGIIVTFAGSNAITQYVESKEITRTLQLVKDELALNKENVRKINARIELEQKACTYILEHRRCLEHASQDTLEIYRNIPMQTRSFRYTKDAIELLKTSSLFQKVEPKTLVLEIIKAYSDLEMVAVNVRGYYDLKSEDIGGLRNKFDVYDKELSESPCEYWEKLLSTQEGWNICNFTVHNFSSPTPFRDIEISLEETIGRLNKEYDLK